MPYPPMLTTGEVLDIEAHRGVAADPEEKNRLRIILRDAYLALPSEGVIPPHAQAVLDRYKIDTDRNSITDMARVLQTIYVIL